jgi:hypothetical protein
MWGREQDGVRFSHLLRVPCNLKFMNCKGGGKGGEMTQTLYAHMNKKNFNKFVFSYI